MLYEYIAFVEKFSVDTGTNLTLRSDVGDLIETVNFASQPVCFADGFFTLE